MKPRAAIFGMPYHHVGGGQLHQAMVADLMTIAYDVDLLHHVPGLTGDDLARQYELDLTRVRVRYIEPFPTVWPYSSEGGKFERRGFAAHRDVTEPYDLFVNVVVNPPIRSYARRSVLLALFPFAGRADVWPWNEPPGRTPFFKRTVRNAYYAARWRRVFSSYERCVANSAFTASWIRARWGLEADIVYPPVRARFTPREKERLILSVGRFSSSGTRKQQLEMVRTFARFHDAHLAGWTFLCVGGLSENPGDLEYFEQVSEAARGYPVRLVANASDEVLRDAYERAAIFWHAAGHGEEDSLHPERTEHFGMSTVEAMAAGCVPVVIRKGGQPEIVEHGRSGFLWETTEELIRCTRELAESPALRRKMADSALDRSRAFTDPEAFSNQMRAILAPG